MDNQPITGGTTRRALLRGAMGATLAVGSRRFSPSAGAAQEAQESIESLWNRTVRRFLLADRWVDVHAYSAGHLLMVPLHAAFTIAPDDAWRSDFAEHAARFMQFVATGGPLPTNRIDRQQYLYLWSQFAILAHRAGVPEIVPPGLVELLTLEQRQLWHVEPAWQWGRVPFTGGMHDRVEWKLATTEVERSYYQAIIDEELFCMAIAADLLELSALHHDEVPSSAAVNAVAMADRIFRQEGVYTSNGGWLFQPGVWKDHPDYAYAGQMEMSPGMAKAPVPGIGVDASHSHRMGRWLQSLAAVAGTPDRDAFYTGILGGLERQLIDVIVVAPGGDFPGYRARNYMDGHNGVFRWEYETLGEHNGYAPFELSGTLCLGWWAFLDTERARDLYRGVSATFPLSPEVLSTYLGPLERIEPKVLSEETMSLTNGFSELVTRLAGELRIGTDS